MDVVGINANEELHAFSVARWAGEAGFQAHWKENERVLDGHHSEEPGGGCVACCAEFFDAGRDLSQMISGVLRSYLGTGNQSMDPRQFRLETRLLAEQRSFPAMRGIGTGESAIVEPLEANDLSAPCHDDLWRHVIAEFCIDPSQATALR
jgi:hypothetical protein